MNSLYQKIVSLFFKEKKPPDNINTTTVKELKEYKTRLYGSLSRDLSEFEKNFLFISVGTLAFSITFIKDIVKIETAVYVNMLFLSWGLIAVSIGIMMFTFIKSAYASDKLWFIIDDFQVENKLFIDTDKITPEGFNNIKKQTSEVFKKSKLILKRMRLTAICFFLCGLCLFGGFTGINTFNENHTKAKEKNSILIKFNTKTRQVIIDDAKFSISDTIVLIEK